MKNVSLLFVLLIPLIAFGETNVDEWGNIDYHLIPKTCIINCPPDTPPGWRDDERLSLNDAAESIAPRGVADTFGRIHAVWKDNRRLHGRDEIHYRVRIDTVWDSLYAISNLDTSHNSPWIAIDKRNNLHVVFLRWFGAPFAYYDVGYRRFNDSLGIWEPEQRLTQTDSIGLAGRPKILCDTNDVIYVLWLNDNDSPRTIWYMTYDSTGWNEKKEVTDINDQPNGYFGVAPAPDNRIHCVWQDYRSGTAELYHRIFENGSWSPAQAITTNGFASVYPRLSADTLGNIHLVYGGGLSLAEKIHYLVWDAATQTWGPETKFPSQMAMPHVDIAVSPLDSDVHLTFHESISGTIEIIYKHYDAGTGQWEPNVQLTFNYPDIRLDPQICLDFNDYVHLLWWDERDLTGQEEIYYKTNRLAPSGFLESSFNLKNSIKLTARPNPFHTQTDIEYQIIDDRLPVADYSIQLKIYDVTGRLVRKWDYQTIRQSNQITWRGYDCPTGIYIVSFECEGICRTIKLIRIR
jgi:hypothetical protein